MSASPFSLPSASYVGLGNRAFCRNAFLFLKKVFGKAQDRHCCECLFFEFPILGIGLILGLMIASLSAGLSAQSYDPRKAGAHVLPHPALRKLQPLFQPPLRWAVS
jgi:hypothetical protein